MGAGHAPLIPLDEALARIDRDHAGVTGVETAPLAAALGRVLAEEVAAPGDVPPMAVWMATACGRPAAAWRRG